MPIYASDIISWILFFFVKLHFVLFVKLIHLIYFIGVLPFQFDIRAHHVERSQRLEMPNDCTAQELFAECEADFGSWIMEPRTALIHWSTAEYDSPVDDVFNSDMQVALK